jgi:hypothetical protein
MVVRPGLTNNIAALFGVGRGADLIIYLSLVGLGLVTLLLYSKLQETEDQLTELVRAIALLKVQMDSTADHLEATNDQIQGIGSPEAN